MNLRSVPKRFGTSIVIVVGIAAVVAVLISVLAMARGFISSATRSGRAERAIVIGRGANSESSGGFSRDNATTILNSPGIRKAADGSPVASAEHLAFVLLPDKRTGRDAFVMVRGVGSQAFALRPEIARSLEIATLRAIGFGAGPVVVSVFVEALPLALAGAVLGAAVAWFFFNGSDVSTTTGNSPSQLTFALSVTPGLIAVGVGCALLIGVLGGLFPAIRAARRPVAMALRA